MHPQFLVWCLTFGAQFKNDGHYFCRAGGNRPDGLNEPVTHYPEIWLHMWESPSFRVRSCQPALH
ncbi:hypothetical protein CYO76_13765 [Salmonella enterica subsp. enterica serovar Schwarzengrund]|nr:hypothetical protein CEP98_25570 [Salmonella enterica subsp. enterica serovar Typhimurium]ECS2202370.1 hypothetical protein [Salmonella enterica subsp. enterica serovar Heidelberg]ECZ8953964.1 hypothetical protein [Salmonella enterica subsp. enterica serovar Schwarzengrund]EDS0699053.1 hypothetical protein [Salmonella enterica subsp. enterica serovar Kentucky]EDV8608147.1 hypothetical protein [Salmonella enterica subsp. enterica serovar Hadar]EFO2680390.1 hypothetical protein [Escherichia c